MTKKDIIHLQKRVVDSLSEDLQRYPDEVRRLLVKMLSPPEEVISRSGCVVEPMAGLILVAALVALVNAIGSGDTRGAMNVAISIGSVLLFGLLVLKMMELLSDMRNRMRVRKVRRILRTLSDAEVAWLTRLLEPKEALVVAKRLTPTTIAFYLRVAVPLRMACLRYGYIKEVGYM